MIRIEMHGRLGNQMFRYALGRALQLKTGLPMKISFFYVPSHKSGNEQAVFNQGFENSLQYFNVMPFEEYTGHGRLLWDSPDLLQKLIGLLYYSYRRVARVLIARLPRLFYNEKRDMQQPWCRLLNHMGLFCIFNYYYQFDNISRKEYYIDGNFECAKYFNSIRNVLLKEFTPKAAPLEHNKELYRALAGRDSVCVSIRSYQEIAHDKAIWDCYRTYDTSYFTRAMQYMAGRLHDPLFLICSDDMDWVKSKLDLSQFNVVYEPSSDPVWEKLRLMYHCKHFIISNSTFSWWAQYLGRYEDKIVVAPQRWFKGNFQGYLLEDYMIRM